MHTIFLTWTEKSAWKSTYGRPVAALWTWDGSDEDLAKAKAYAAKFEGYKVYATATNEYANVANVKRAALAAHR